MAWLPLALALLLLGARSAGAVEGEWQLGLQPSYAMAYAEERPVSGGGGLVHLSFSPRDALSLQLLGGVTAHPLGDGAAPGGTAPAPRGTLLGFSAGAGLVYVLDVVRVVPFFEGFVGLVGQSRPGEGGPETRLGLGLGVGLGADYLVSRRLAVGVALRWSVALTDLDGMPFSLTVGPRLVARFGP